MVNVTATDVANAPMTPEAAVARMDQLKGDPDFQKRVAARDSEAFAEHTRLWRVARGMSPEPLPPATPEEVRATMQERDLAIDDARVETYAKFISGFDDVQRATIRRGLATQAQHDEATRELERMKRDGVFARKILSGESDAVDRWTRFNLIAALRVAPADYKW